MSRKIFLDCGANEGQGFLQFVKMGKISSDTEVHSFEPNPYCKIDEFRLSEIAKSQGISPRVKFHRSAVLHEDGVCSIVVSRDLDRRNGEGTAVHGVRNVNTINNLHLQGLEIVVASTSLTNFIDKLEMSDEDELRIKIDIEGSEFLVLESMLKNFNCWNNLKEIWVEWHERYMTGFDASSLRSSIQERFEQKGIKIIDWQ